jgi:hypothetical protein
LSGINVEAIDQRFRLVISVGVEELMRMTVIPEKAAKAEHIAVVGATDDNRPASSGFKQPDAAEDQGGPQAARGKQLPPRAVN